MSSQDRWIVVIAAGVMGLALCAAGWLLGQANRQRVELELTVNPDVYRNMPPAVALTQTALGSFRALAVDVMWQRHWKLQQEGKFYEAEQLSKMITTLQPRFSEVWANRAWNLAYNISVATHTPEERWHWVRAGIDLLRGTASEAGGIELNPTAVKLYKELSWIFLHKIGQYSDDMHKYYKYELALEWHEVLGPEPAESTAAMLDWFRPIVEADALANGQPADVEALLARQDPLGPVGQAGQEQSPGSSRSSGGRAGSVESIAFRPVPARYGPEHLQRYLEARPQVAEQVRRLEAMGYQPDRHWLVSLARLEGRRQAVRNGYLPADTPVAQQRKEQLLLEWLDEQGQSPSARWLLDYARAQTLVNDYRMNPLFMYTLMQGQWLKMDKDWPVVEEFRIDRPEQPVPLPLDWRHPATHGLYWAALGVRMSQAHPGQDDPYYFTVLNTDRQVLHALQSLTHTGRLIFDPVTGYYAMMPDIRYIAAYERTMVSSTGRIGGQYKQSTAPQTFQAGHENFLIWATRTCWFYGDKQQSQQLYQRLRLLYGLSQADRLDKYSQPLRDFVVADFKDDMISLVDARAIILGLIRQSLVEGYANYNGPLAVELMSTARYLHGWYQKKKADQRHYAMPEGRLTLRPFDDLAAETLGELMTSPLPLSMKVRIWSNPYSDVYLESLKRRIYDQVRDMLDRQAQAMGGRAEVLFAEPAGMAEYRRAHPPKKTTSPGDSQNSQAPVRVEIK